MSKSPLEVILECTIAPDTFAPRKSSVACIAPIAELAAQRRRSRKARGLKGVRHRYFRSVRRIMRFEVGCRAKAASARE
jgi:hypothetical protein